MKTRLPLTKLSYSQWRRLFDFGALAMLLVFLAYVGAEVYLVRGVDYRGYYAAARVVLSGGNPYDYQLVSQVLMNVTGEMGNNPYYYPPWFVLINVPLALLPFRVARLVWVVLLVVAFWYGAQIALEVMHWDLRGWRRSLVLLSGAYLFFWLSARSEQVGTVLFTLSVLSLWGHQRDRAWLSGVTLALLLTKPNVTWLMVPLLGLLYWKQQRRAVWWALAALALLLVVSTLILPGWYTEVTKPGFGEGLTMELDGPDRVKSGRLNTVLSDWLRPWGIAGTWYRVIWTILAVGGALTLWRAWRHSDDESYWLSLATAVGLLVTPYALQYDYPPLILGLFWIWRALSTARGPRRLIAIAVLAFVFTVPVWERPVYEGYWILLGVVYLLLSLQSHLWSPHGRPVGASQD